MMMRWTIVFSCLCAVLRAHTVVTFQPDSACGKDAIVSSLWPNTNSGAHPDFIATAWTNGGNPSTTRALVSFDLAVIPPGASIVSATLELFHYNSPNNIGHSNMSGPAACWLERIVQPWTEMSVTWNNQPATSSVNQLNIPAPTSNTQNYSINVVSLVIDMMNDPANSYGFMLRLQNEAYYRSLLFASSDMSVSGLHPKLTVTYSLDTAPLPGCYTNYIISPTAPPPLPSTPDPVVLLPNVFTPDGDGINDFFYADTVSFSVDEFLVFDRWGVLVFESRPGLPWNGQSNNGKECTDGTYYYVFRYKWSGGEKTLTGFVTLIR